MINNATNIILWNANGLIQHKHELHNFLIQNIIHIALITETHLTKTLKLKLPGYSIYRADHPDGTAYAGSAIIIAINLNHNLHLINPQANLQSVSIQIFLNHVPLILASVYCPPSQKIITQDFAQLFNSLGKKFIAGGDFNSKHPLWGCRYTSPRGKILHKTITDHK